MMAYTLAVARPAAALRLCRRENLAGYPQRLTPRKFSGYSAQLVYHAPQGTVLPISFPG
jgi:hypothetical protein